MKNIINILTPQQRRIQYMKKHYKDIYNEIISFNKNIETNNFSQMCYNYTNGLTKLPICKCGKELKFKNFNFGYYKYCSKKCVMNDKELVETRNSKSIKTNMEKYGVDNPMKLQKVKDKVVKTNMEKYGVDNPMKLQKIKDKVVKTNMEKYGKEYYFQTEEYKNKVFLYSMKKYGKKHYNQSKIVLNKKYSTNLEKYGYKNPLKNDIIKNKSLNTNLEKYGEKHHMIEKSKKGLLDIIHKEKSLLYYKNQLNDKNYTILDINNDELLIEHKNCCNFYINKQLFYLRNKSNHIICTKCNQLNNNTVSESEKELLKFIEKNYGGEIITNSKSIINPYELDIYLPNLNLAFEFNGLYWHNELNKPNNYHKIKTDMCDDKGIQLIHIYEDDWNYKQDIIKSMILNRLGKTTERIYARKTIIKEINDNRLVRNFLNNNHIQGFVGSSIKLGLFYNNELVSLMTFGKLRKSLNSTTIENEWEMLRFCNKLNTNIIGGASKLFKYFINNFKYNKIVSYADRSYSNGNLYKQLYFKKISISNPNYFYIVYKTKRYRFGFRKDILVKQGYDSNKSEHEIMLERNIYRIYNSGNYKFEYIS
jgi:hypothetical protein